MAAGLEGKLIWERLEHLRETGVHTERDRELESNLEARFGEIVTLMNRYGIASPAQWEEDPDYWRMVNAPLGAAQGACFCPPNPAAEQPSGAASGAHAAPCTVRGPLAMDAGLAAPGAAAGGGAAVADRHASYPGAAGGLPASGTLRVIAILYGLG